MELAQANGFGPEPDELLVLRRKDVTVAAPPTPFLGNAGETDQVFDGLLGDVMHTQQRTVSPAATDPDIARSQVRSKWLGDAVRADPSSTSR